MNVLLLVLCPNYTLLCNLYCIYIYRYKYFLYKYKFVQQRKLLVVGCVLAYAVLVEAVNYLLLAWLAVRLTVWENHKTQEEFAASLERKVFASYFLNAFLWFFCNLLGEVLRPELLEDQREAL